MEKFFGVKRQAFVKAGVSNSLLNVLTQRSQYFSKRKANIFTQFDAALIFAAHELSDFMPFRGVDNAIDDIVKNYRNLWGLLSQNPAQFLVVEKVIAAPEIEAVLPLDLTENVTYIQLAEDLLHGSFDLINRRAMLLINLKQIFERVQDLFEAEGFLIGEVGWEE